MTALALVPDPMLLGTGPNYPPIQQVTENRGFNQIQKFFHRYTPVRWPIYAMHKYFFPVHKCISECTNLFLSAQINFSVHKSISQCTNVFLSAWLHGFPAHFCCSVGTFCSCHLPCKSIGLREYFNSTPESMFCACCGAQVQISFSFCPSCGGSLKSTNDPDCISRVKNVGRETAAINSRKRASSSQLTRPELQITDHKFSQTMHRGYVLAYPD